VNNQVSDNRKLLVGAVFLAILVALTVLQVPHAERLTDMLYGALLGMGIMHVDDRKHAKSSGASPTNQVAPAHPPDVDTVKQAGFVLPALLSMLAILATTAMLLSACATPQSASWGTGFDVALHLRQAGKLNRAQIDQITLLDSQITPLCTGPLPADPSAAARQVTAAVTTLTILGLAAKEAK
jgi:hypothetical protein